jgi:hypothetical protein
VKLIGIPGDVRDDEHLATRDLFAKSLGRSFVVTAVEAVAGFPQSLARLEVGEVVGAPPARHVIWAEAEYLEIQPPS